MSADPVAEVLARVLSEHLPIFGAGLSGDRTWIACCCDTDTMLIAWSSVEPMLDEAEWVAEFRAHLAEVAAAALREAGLIPEATTQVEMGWHWPSSGVRNRIRRTRTTYADHVTEWEAVE